MGLATVMGHEVSHALANHGAQRMSAAQLREIGCRSCRSYQVKVKKAQQTWKPMVLVQK
jgi:predicted Zn-dependent protease